MDEELQKLYVNELHLLYVISEKDKKIKSLNQELDNLRKDLNGGTNEF